MQLFSRVILVFVGAVIAAGVFAGDDPIEKAIKARRANTAPKYIDIADRCLRRLSKKGNRLLLSGKHPNKVKVACAREMVGFVWESLNHAAP